MVAAVVLGAVSHGIGQVLRFQVQGLPDLKANPDIEMLVQVILGICDFHCASAMCCGCNRNAS